MHGCNVRDNVARYDTRIRVDRILRIKSSLQKSERGKMFGAPRRGKILLKGPVL